MTLPHKKQAGFAPGLLWVTRVRRRSVATRSLLHQRSLLLLLLVPWLPVPELLEPDVLLPPLVPDPP
jgi:hypothetical protein